MIAFAACQFVRTNDCLAVRAVWSDAIISHTVVQLRKWRVNLKLAILFGIFFLFSANVVAYNQPNWKFIWLKSLLSYGMGSCRRIRRTSDNPNPIPNCNLTLSVEIDDSKKTTPPAPMLFTGVIESVLRKSQPASYIFKVHSDSTTIKQSQHSIAQHSGCDGRKPKASMPIY